MCSSDLEAIAGVLNEWLVGQASALLTRWDARFDVYGRWEALCPEIGEGVAAARRTAGSRRFVLLMAYDGREELVAAASKGPSNLEEMGRGLWTGDLPPVDLLVRTGGEPHLSAGFMLWHLAEAQLAFEPALWPEFDEAALTAVLARYAATARRFGA